MTNTTLMLVFGGCLLGIFQLAVGLALGLWLRHRPGAAPRREDDMRQASAIAKRLQTLANEMVSVVGEHCTELEQASNLLRAEGSPTGDTIADLVMNVVGNIVHSNQGLQSKLDTAESRLQEQAVEIEAHISRSLTDPLTGLPNRREFNERLEERMSAWKRRRESFSLLLLDVDHFKKLNDVYGHLVGDQVLATLGNALRTAIRREDAVARYGGEEFAVLLPNTSLDQAILVVRKVREVAGQIAVTHNEQRIAITMSGGLATIQPNEQVESLIQRADAALYAAKSAGRNCSFAHDGVNCCPAEGQRAEAPAQSSRLIELINAPEATKPEEDPTTTEAESEFGNFLQRDKISTALADTCKELRRFLDTRGQSAEPTPAIPRA
ncbi:MAG TPA: GGDEF domain-containing protein [Lacipirellulaceae bacterium]|nr:GGDEF domain-containing protein [Lacipirellulaceae bacterium]